MNAILIRYQLAEPNPSKSSDIRDLLRRLYGGAVTYVAHDTIFIDTLDRVAEVYKVMEPLFTFDDKLFVGELKDFQSLHSISRTQPSLHKVAI